MELSSRCKDSIVIKYHDRQHEAIQWGSRCLCSVFRRVIVIFQRALLQPCFSLKFKKWTETVSSTRARGARANLFQASQWAAHQPVKRGQAAREKYSLYMMPCILWLRLEVGRDKQEGEEKRKKNTKKRGLWLWWGILDDWAQMKIITTPSVICDVLPFLNNIKQLNEPKRSRKITQTLRYPSLVYIGKLKLWEKCFGYNLSSFYFAPCLRDRDVYDLHCRLGSRWTCFPFAKKSQ